MAKAEQYGPGQIPALTGVRALAAFLVFFHHHPTKVLEMGPLLIWWELHVGVTLFFVLSGFVITWRYDRRGPRRESFLRGYFVNRFARIYPLYFVLVVPVMLVYGVRSWRAWALNLTVFSHLENGIPQAWSLRVEECFYLSAPFLFLLWRKRPILPLVAAVLVVGALYPVAMANAMPKAVGTPTNMFIYTFPGRFFEFYCGMWLAKRVARTGPAESPARKFPVWTLAGLAGIVAVVAALATIHYETKHAYAYGLYHPAGVALNNLVLPVFIAAFYWGLIRERSVLRWILSTRIANLLGRSSYAFYLIHTGPPLALFMAVTVAGAGRFGPASAAAASSLLLGSVAVRFLYVTVLSIALYKAIEMPANRFIRRRFAAPREAPAPIPETAALT